MDIACPKCGEPFGIDALHEYVGETVHIPATKTKPSEEVVLTSFKQAKNLFFTKGCGVLCEGIACHAETERDKTRAAFSSALEDLLGDDIDGIASELDDAEYFGLI